MCTKEKHGLVGDFAWYISILYDLTKYCSSMTQIGSSRVTTIANELVEITLRVESVRPFAVECMVGLLLDESILASQQRMVLAEVNVKLWCGKLNNAIVCRF